MGLFSKLFGRTDEADVQDYTSEFSSNPDVFAAANAVCCPSEANACFAVSDVFTISGRGIVVKGTVAGTVVTGTVTKGTFKVGDRAKVNGIETTITGIEQFRKKLDTVNEGDNAGILLRDVSRGQISKGDLIIK